MTKKKEPDVIDEALALIKSPKIKKMFENKQCLQLFQSLSNEFLLTLAPEQSIYSVVSAQSGEGRTTIALLMGLLSAAVEPKRKVLLIDGHLDKGDLTAELNISPDLQGIDSFVGSDLEIDNVIHKTELDNLFIVPTHSKTNPRRFYVYDQVNMLIHLIVSERSDQFDLIIIDTPPAQRGNDYLTLAQAAKNTLVAIKYRGPNRQQIQLMLSELNRLNVNVLGSVLNRRIFSIPRFFYRR